MTDDYDGGGLAAPPHDNDAEQGVLGSMLLSKAAIDDVVDTIRGDDFYRPVHGTIYDTILDLYGRGEPVDPITVAAALDTVGELGRVGGGPYLHTLTADVPVAANAAYYAEIVRDKAVLRRLAEAGDKIRRLAHSGHGDVADVVDRSHAELDSATPTGRVHDYRPVGDSIEDTMDAMEAMAAGGDTHGIPTGFIDLDTLTNGWQPGQMVIVAGRPGLGKSTLATDFCRAASIRHSYTSMICSLEMSRQEITMRILSAEAKVPLAGVRSGGLDERDWQRVAAHTGEIQQARLFIDDSPNLTPTEIRAKARRLKQTHDLRLLVVDYMQLMSSGRKVENRQMEVSEFSRQLKLLAKELEVTVVALSQLNRGPEQRTSKRPVMADLRESGSLEQDADIVLLLHRDDAYEVESARPGEADLIVAKHRNGPTRDIALAFQGHYSRFVDMAT